MKEEAPGEMPVLMANVSIRHGIFVEDGGVQAVVACVEKHAPFRAARALVNQKRTESVDAAYWLLPAAGVRREIVRLELAGEFGASSPVAGGDEYPQLAWLWFERPGFEKTYATESVNVARRQLLNRQRELFRGSSFGMLF